MLVIFEASRMWSVCLGPTSSKRARNALCSFQHNAMVLLLALQRQALAQ